MTNPTSEPKEHERQHCSCTFGISPACPAHGKKKRDRRVAPATPAEAAAPLDNRALAVRLHEVVHGSDDNCAHGGIGCPIRRDINVELQRSALSSRDTEVREVLEGLVTCVVDEGGGPRMHWCPLGEDSDMECGPSCDAARDLYAKLQPLPSERLLKNEM